MKNENEIDNLENNNAVKKENKFLKFIFKHKYYLGLILIIIIVAIWALVKINILQRTFNEEKAQIVASYEQKLDNLNSDRLLLTAKTFSWAIRSELIRDNKDQVNQFFNDFIKGSDIEKLQLINPETSIIEISTDKKDEGTTISIYSSLEDQIVNTTSTNFQIITPITGLNKKMGIFVMYVNNLNHK